MKLLKKLTIGVVTLLAGASLTACSNPFEKSAEKPTVQQESFNRNFWKEPGNKYIQYDKMTEKQKSLMDDIYKDKTDEELKADKEAFDKESPTIMKGAMEIINANSGSSDTLGTLAKAPMALYHAYTQTLNVEKPEYVGYYLVAINDETWWLEAFSGNTLAASTVISNITEIVSATYRTFGLNATQRAAAERAFSAYQIRPASMGDFGKDVSVYVDAQNNIVVEIPTVIYKASDKEQKTIATADGKPFMVAMRWIPTAGSGYNSQRDHLFGFTQGKDGKNGFVKIMEEIVKSHNATTV